MTVVHTQLYTEDLRRAEPRPLDVAMCACCWSRLGPRASVLETGMVKDCKDAGGMLKVLWGGIKSKEPPFMTCKGQHQSVRP